MQKQGSTPEDECRNVRRHHFGEPERETNTSHNHRSPKDRLFDPDYGKGNASEDENNGKQRSGITSCQTGLTHLSVALSTYFDKNFNAAAQTGGL